MINSNKIVYHLQICSQTFPIQVVAGYSYNWVAGRRICYVYILEYVIFVEVVMNKVIQEL